MSRVVVVTLLGLTLTGCLEVCARAEVLNADFPVRHQACFPDGTLQNARFDLEQCDESMKGCTATDEESIQDYFDCIDRLPTCTAENKATFNDAFLKCAQGMTAVTPGCFRP